jgi:hypothetical protein
MLLKLTDLEGRFCTKKRAQGARGTRLDSTGSAGAASSCAQVCAGGWVAEEFSDAGVDSRYTVQDSTEVL